jgi:subtilisin-like proprotein convertase family protein
MKKLIFVFLAVIIFTTSIYSQFINDPKIDSVVNLVSISSLSIFMRELTGDTITNIGGSPYRIYSRYSLSPANQKAAQYIFEKFQSFGYNVRYQIGDTNSVNVIARKTGIKYPNQKIVIGAHYDNIHWPELPGPLDTVHGADDDGSGIIALLEMARLTAGMTFDYTIEFAAWDNEEIGMYGSKYYADSAYYHGDSIKTYINIDMIAFNYLNLNYFYANADSNSVFYKYIFNALKIKYIPQYVFREQSVFNFGSDNYSFLNRHYRTFCLSEYAIQANPNYHKITDNFENANMLYCRDLIKPIFGMLLVLAGNKNAFFEHYPLISTSDTTSRNLWAIIKFPEKLPVTNNAPRLYYKINSLSYNYTTAYFQNRDTFKFTLPGVSKGSSVKYYFAAQDSIGIFVCTYPIGGSGVNPPGSTPPANTFSYNVYNYLSACSNTLPKPINDFQYTSDSIYLNSPGYVNKVRVNLSLNHTNDGDIIIQLIGPGGLINLSQRNGSNGQNYINTIFDDTAAISITQGVPPFTGTYRPQAPLSFFNDKPVSGYWVLRVFDVAAGNTGTLTNWCIQIETKANVGVEENIIPVIFELSQNYPNPFNPVSTIKYNVAKNSLVKIVIFDILGRKLNEVVNKYHTVGNYSVVINASELASGVYFYRMEAEGFIGVKKFVVLK